MSRDIDPRLLEPFIVVAETLHFGRAAERLLMDQSALSRQIAPLESQVGEQLFTRSSRNVELTDAGRAVLAVAHEVAAVALRAAEVARTQDAELTLRVHNLRVESPEIHSMLSRFAGARPHIGIRLVDGGTWDPVDALAAGTVDIGVLYDFARAPEYGWQWFTSIDYGVHSRVDHRFAAMGRVRWADFEGEHVFVAPAPGPEAYNTYLRTQWATAAIQVVEHLAPANRAVMLAESLVAGHCIAILPRDIVPVHPELAWYPIDPPWRVDYGIAWDTRSTNPAVHDLVRWLRRMERRQAAPA